MRYMTERKDFVKRKTIKTDGLVNPLNRNEKKYNKYEIEEFKYKYLIWKDKPFYNSVDEFMGGVIFGFICLFCIIGVFLIIGGNGFLNSEQGFFAALGFSVFEVITVFAIYPIIKFPFWIISRIGVVRK